MGLSAAPADRAAAEGAIVELYRLLGEPPPEIVWVPSPVAAVAVLREDPDGVPEGFGRVPNGLASSKWPFLQRFSALKHGMRQRLVDRTEPDDRFWSYGSRIPFHEWSVMPPGELLASGVPPRRILDIRVHQPLRESLRDNLYRLLRHSMLGTDGQRDAVAGYDQYDTWTVGFHALNRSAGLIRCRGDDAHQLEQWVTLARSAGWWWPGPHRCVITERPVAVHTEPNAGAVYGETRLHNPDGRAVEFADGTGLFVLHGTPVPDWVMAAPSVDRILAERNIEIRRAAIERIGWDSYIDQAGLTLVSQADDPGNPGAELRLYDMPREHLGSSARILLVVNGSRERDGSRRRYGVNVPGTIDDPIAAAGWSYGLSATHYAQLLRRT
ncbi:DUF6745 domain-containing protein [Nocardia sp. NPDC050406]|uniref:DUF6745 domain-containing protein n=1 Tax=Nocardia sp. NPDC050406 TaxID=3364318 RepID=UPI0037A99FAE